MQHILGKDAINRVSTDGLFVAFFFQIGITILRSPGEVTVSLNSSYHGDEADRAETLIKSVISYQLSVLTAYGGG